MPTDVVSKKIQFDVLSTGLDKVLKSLTETTKAISNIQKALNLNFKEQTKELEKQTKELEKQKKIWADTLAEQDKIRQGRNLLEKQKKPNKYAQGIAAIDKQLSDLDPDNPEDKAKYEQLLKERGALAEQEGKLNTRAKTFEAVMKQVTKIAKTLLKPLKDLADGAIGAAKELLSLKSGAATYNASTSLITNAAARQEMMKYGLSASGEFAFSRAKGMLGIQTDEDLMYMNAAQREKLLQYMDKYSQWYSKMEQSGVLESVQSMQLEFEELKQELSMEFLEWVAENKDVIITAVKGIFEVIKFIANLVIGILNFITLGHFNGSSDFSDSIGVNGNSNSKVNNITINANTTNNANGITATDMLSSYNDAQWSDLAKKIVTATE